MRGTIINPAKEFTTRCNVVIKSWRDFSDTQDKGLRYVLYFKTTGLVVPPYYFELVYVNNNFMLYSLNIAKHTVSIEIR